MHDGVVAKVELREGKGKAPEGVEALDGGIADVIVTEREELDRWVGSEERHEKDKTAIAEIIVVQVELAKTTSSQIRQST